MGDDLGAAPAFLPLTVSAAHATPESIEVHGAARAADHAAVECWTTLLAGCGGPGRRCLPARLRELTEATAGYVGPGWWFSDGSVHRSRVMEAQLRIEDAVREGDGEEFAEAFIAFDQAVATTVVCSPSRSSGGKSGLPVQRGEDQALSDHSA